MVLPDDKYLTLDEITRLLVSIDSKRDKLLIQLGLVMGCRVSEIVNIRVKNISPGVIRIWDEKKDRYRDCVIDDDTADLLRQWLDSGWVAKQHKRHMLFYFSTKTANRILKHWFKTAEIPKVKAHWHTLRHTYAIQSLEAGVPLNHICEQTGDSPMTILRVYGRPSTDARRSKLEETKYWSDKP